MRTSYSVCAWKDDRKPAQFHIERLSKKKAVYIFDSFVKSDEWIQVVMKRLWF